ncbi:DEAD/DEAH box helicase [Quadrisphaera sp. DSM 44207]|uniref:Lhr family helicase n=1 Tax=Quadrisphaera sp. DSM 44207 TaxID=1881057 RepID=UPI000886B18D|nr:DEAD/DEAH box helicase [Quadrisphaera sp. DSM 44207]SDQ33661.1 ATP dependent helicase, Lhr family [Quadrisphaera sp. DSM 44207]
MAQRRGTPATTGVGDDGDVLERFSAPTRDWFRGAFAAPTAAQEGAWRAISAGDHALVVAPTGSGKTLSAFLWALDRIATSPVPEDLQRRCRVVYVSPLKALATDVERNLRAPLTGMRHAAQRLGLPLPEVSVALRSGDTPAQERRAFTRTPPDVLITTPESLFLLLTSAAREVLAGVETVVVDEVHAVAGTKRGAHLALTLERLDALLPVPAQRIGLSATVRPVEEVARFLAGARPVGTAVPGGDAAGGAVAGDGGGRPVTVVQPPSTKVVELEVVVPVPDMGELGQRTEDLTGLAAGAEPRASIWPAVEERVVDLVASHRSTLVFANSRRLAERLTTRLNEIWAERAAAEQAAEQGVEQGAEEAGPDEDGGVAVGAAAAQTPSRPPAQVMAQAGRGGAAPAVLARAHHGSVSREQRSLIEDDLKSGRLPAVVATSSLELGIDMGAVDLVVQVESPPSVASGLQRVGRAGHQVGAVSHGVVFPKYRGDLVQTAVVTERMRAGAIEALRVPSSPLDVLAQQVVAMTAMEDWPVDDLERVVRRAAPFAGLTRGVLEAVLDMLSGRYPSEEFAELRPRIVWDRVAGTLSGRPGAQRLAVTSGGTIPDRGLYGVFLATGEGPGRRVGELDEEMVYESRVGDVFTLGTSTWRIEDITADQVLVSPAPGLPGKLPFWHGEALGRPAELGRAVGAFVREVGALDDERARARAREAGLDEWAADNLLAYLREQQEATGHLPDDRTIVIERFRDELGDWRVVVHSPFGAQLHAPWALAVGARLRERFGVDVQAMSADDGLVLRLPDLDLLSGLGDDLGASLTGAGGGSGRSEAPDVLEAVLVEPEDVETLVTAELGGSALFASRFRECAARSLLLPRRRPDRRTPLWQQRQRAAQLLEVASRYPSFPVVLETVRECLQDVFDVPALADLMRSLRSGAVRVVQVTTEQASPFARGLLFGYVAQFLYEGDTPLAEKRAAALSLDPTLLAELLGRGDGASLADLLDAEALARTQAELQRLAEDRRCRDAEDVADLLRVLGPLGTAEVAARSRADEPEAARWLAELEASRRVIAVRIAGEARWAVVEDAGRLRDALGVPLPVGVPEAFTAPLPDPVADLVARYARTHVPFTAAVVAARLGTGVAVVTDALRRLERSGRLVSGDLLPPEVRASLDGAVPGTPGSVPDWCDAEVLRLLRRRSLAALRADVEPVPPRDLALFLPGWQGVGSRLRGADGVLRVVEQLAGAVLPASAIESLVLPVRVERYAPALLDELTASGEVLWRGHGALPGDDGWVSLHLADSAAVTLAPPEDDLELTDAHARVLEALSGGGAYFFRALSDAVGSTVPREREAPPDAALADLLWDLVWAGHLTNDTLAPLRARLAGGRTAHRAPRAAPRARYGRLRPGRPGRPGAGALPARSGPPTAAGRWSLLPQAEPDATVRAAATAEVLLDRHGVLTRGAVAAERLPGGFAAVYRVLAAMEEAGRVRRGYFVEGLGASQFASTGAVDRLRAAARPLSAVGAGQWQPSDHRGAGGAEADRPRTVVLAAADPANPYGAALPWPEREAVPGREGAVPRKREVPPGAGHRPGRKAGALVVLLDGDLVLYVERGGRTLLSFTEDPQALQAGADALALAVRDGALGRLTVQRADGEGVLAPGGSALGAALEAAGFTATPRGLRVRA